MLEQISINSKYYYHNILSFIMLLVWVFIFLKGYSLNNKKSRNKISIYIIIFCLFQEIVDFINRIFLDQNYTFSIITDLPLLQFCQISFYFSIVCILLSRKEIKFHKKYSINQFLFDCSFLLGFSGALQGILTPDFKNINNFLGVICIQLQHSLIILNLIWLLSAYRFRLKFKGVCYTYIFINLIAPSALVINSFLGSNSIGEHANYFYVNKLPEIDNFFLNFVSDYPSPDYIFYIQPIFIIYFLLLYVPFGIIAIRNKE